MSERIPWADKTEMDRRETAANEFYVVTGAEIAPIVTDEANWYDFDYMDDESLIAAVKSHYGIALEPSMLFQPFWKLLDFLSMHRT